MNGKTKRVKGIKKFFIQRLNATIIFLFLSVIIIVAMSPPACAAPCDKSDRWWKKDLKWNVAWCQDSESCEIEILRVTPKEETIYNTFIVESAVPCRGPPGVTVTIGGEYTHTMSTSWEIASTVGVELGSDDVGKIKSEVSSQLGGGEAVEVKAKVEQGLTFICEEGKVTGNINFYKQDATAFVAEKLTVTGEYCTPWCQWGKTCVGKSTYTSRHYGTVELRRASKITLENVIPDVEKCYHVPGCEKENKTTETGVKPSRYIIDGAEGVKIKINNDAFSGDLGNYSFKIKSIITDTETRQVIGVLIAVKKPDGTEVYTPATRNKNGQVDNIELKFLDVIVKGDFITADIVAYSGYTMVINDHDVDEEKSTIGMKDIVGFVILPALLFFCFISSRAIFRRKKSIIFVAILLFVIILLFFLVFVMDRDSAEKIYMENNKRSFNEERAINALKKANSYENQGMHKEAIEWYQNILTYGVYDKDLIYERLGYNYALLGNNEMALKYYKLVKEENPNYRDIFYIDMLILEYKYKLRDKGRYLGRYPTDPNYYIEAEEFLRKYKDEPRAYLFEDLLASQYYLIGNYEKSIEHHKNILSNPHFWKDLGNSTMGATHYGDLALAYEANGERKKAKETIIEGKNKFGELFPDWEMYNKLLRD